MSLYCVTFVQMFASLPSFQSFLMEWRGGVGGGGVSESIPPALPHLENDVEKYLMINTA